MYFKYLPLTVSVCTRRYPLYRRISETILFQCKTPGTRWNCLKIQRSNFHTTQNYHVSLSVSIASILSGYFVRKWWLKLNPDRQEKYLTWYMQRRHIFYGCLGFVSFLLIMYCLTSFVRDPIMHKPRLILLDQAAQMEQAQTLYNIMVQSKENVVPLTNPMYKRVARSISKLRNANKKIFDGIDWSVTIIYRAFNLISMPNVLILPDRHIIILVDIFKFIQSDDQLTFILAHEMSHEMLLHTSEISSLIIVIDFLTFVLVFLIWAFYPRRQAAMFCSGLYILFTSIFCRHRRHLEAEADELGLQLSAKTCIDVREILVFWEIMKKYEKLSGQDKFHIPLLMEHPSLDERQKATIQQMPQILKLREQAGCPEIPESDPRDRLPYYMKNIEEYMQNGTRFWGMKL